MAITEKTKRAIKISILFPFVCLYGINYTRTRENGNQYSSSPVNYGRQYVKSKKITTKPNTSTTVRKTASIFAIIKCPYIKKLAVILQPPPRGYDPSGLTAYAIL